MPMALNDIENTAYTCHMGTNEYLKMAFGPTNAPATCQLALDIILYETMRQICFLHLDDVIVFSDTPEKRVKALEEALTRLGRTGVILKAKECDSFPFSARCLGHNISPGEMRV